MGTELVGPVSNLELGEDGDHPELTAKLVQIMKTLNYDTLNKLSNCRTFIIEYLKNFLFDKLLYLL